MKRILQCPQTGDDIDGCGSYFAVDVEHLADDPDGWADCPKCGLGFDPDHRENRPQGGR